MFNRDYLSTNTVSQLATTEVASHSKLDEGHLWAQSWFTKGKAVSQLEEPFLHT